MWFQCQVHWPDDCRVGSSDRGKRPVANARRFKPLRCKSCFLPKIYIYNTTQEPQLISFPVQHHFRWPSGGG